MSNKEQQEEKVLETWTRPLTPEQRKKAIARIGQGLFNECIPRGYWKVHEIHPEGEQSNEAEQ